MAESTQIIIDITNKCNYNCVYCGRKGNDYADSSNTQLEMSAKDIKQIISKITPKCITFSGGEPLYDATNTEKLIDVLKFCKDEGGINTALFTNGYGLYDNPKLLKTLYQYVSAIQIGVHDYESLDYVKGIIDWKTQNKEFDIPILKIHFIINNETKNYIEKINELISSVGIDNILTHNIYFAFFDMIPIGRSNDIESLALEKDSLIMDNLKELYETIYIDLEELEHFNVVIKDKNKESNLDYLYLFS